MSELVELAKRFLRSGGDQGDKLPIAPLEDFETKNWAVRIRSKVLGGDIWLVSNETVRDNLRAEGLVCYLAEEIPYLRGLSPEDLRKINEVKTVFEKSQVIER